MSKYISNAEKPAKTLDLLNELVSDHGRGKAAFLIGCTYSYIHQMQSGKQPITKPIAKKIRAAAGAAKKKRGPATLAIYLDKGQKRFVRAYISSYEAGEILLAVAKIKGNPEISPEDLLDFLITEYRGKPVNPGLTISVLPGDTKKV